ncbi:DoxX family protein [Paenibacillus sp. JDR-2]|uniref:DoxX family protein n=1 Tax=Paenibacillus sp. (strain JDR-2) TaxID=324057 RepID=UPI0001663F1A|nr:DoxX family protein [Paenibacillus sp. JDR-2]ACT02864.1 DoxX family protein [Paenibacillus sp. JDR-2]
MLTMILQVIVGVFFMFTGIRIISGKMAHEFKRFGLPPFFNFVTGLIEIVSSIGMIVGIWFSITAVIAGLLLAATMLAAAFILIVVAKDPFSKAIPSIVLSLLSFVITMSLLL